MSCVVRMSEAGALAVYATMSLATLDDGERLTIRQLARSLHASEHHLAKVLQRLTHEGLIVAARGSQGGFSLARPADDVTLAEVVSVFDGSPAWDDCLLRMPHPAATADNPCVLSQFLQSINRQVMDFFAVTTLAQATSGHTRGTRSSSGS